MKCEEFDKLIYLFWDGRLNQGREKELKEHLSRCEKCAEKLALLESVEGRAKKIEVKEPSREYWDSFASRVRERIVARKERSPAFGLKKALESIFTFSPLRMKVAAGLVSIVLVFIIGKLYLDYRGEEMLPSKTAVQPEKPPRPDIQEMERKEEPPKEETGKRTEAVSEKPDTEIEPIIGERREDKAVPPKKAEDTKQTLQEKKAPLSAEVKEYKAASADEPTVKEKPPKEDEIRLEQPTIPPPEAYEVGAGVEKIAEGALERGIHVPEESAVDTKEVAEKGEADRLTVKHVGVPAKFADQPLVPVDHYLVNDTTISKIGEHDTTMQADELRRIIKAWKTHIKENPDDSLSQQGYLQVAIGYYLLAKVSQDTTVISEGSELIEEYLDQIQDPFLKESLSDKLMSIKALRQR